MNKKTITFIIIVMILSALLFGCAPESPPKTDDTGATTSGVNSVIDANNQFALDLYAQFKDKKGNVFFSPYSISSALAMTYEGAREQTAQEMQSVFHFPEDTSMLRSSFARIYNQINAPDKKYKLHTANALWAQEDYPFLSEYTNTILNYYGGKTTNLDFVTETEKSRKIINSWVEEQTNNKIKDLIPAGLLSPMTRLVLTNAIYFKGIWLNLFDEERTREEDFRISPDNIIKVPMMKLTEDFNYAETEDLQILEMMYEGEELSMLILLPKEDNLKALEDAISKEKLAEWRNLLKKQEISVRMPKFTFETKYFMANMLAEMGMPTAFSEDADFSGMDGTKDLFISKVIHQTFVEVNEEGTEAAAATAVAMEIKAAPTQPKTFRADRPFIFMIQQRETGNILFLGKVVNPLQE